MDKIKPCPFCGEKDELPVIRERYGIHRVVCNRCDTYGPKGYGEEKAVLLWNHAPRVGDNDCAYLNFTGGCHIFPEENQEESKMKKNCLSCEYNVNGYCFSGPPYKSFKISEDLCCADWEPKKLELPPLTPSNSMGLDTINEITKKTRMEENVRQLLEEASELIVACCKYLRVCGIGQPTPIIEDQALTMIGEEMADAHIVGRVLRNQSECLSSVYTKTCDGKADRWLKRLNGKDDEKTP